MAAGVLPSWEATSLLIFNMSCGGGRLMIARQVDDLRQFPERTLNDRCPLVELGEVNVTQRCRNS